jgi:Uma2 family endonuclease
MVTAIAPKITSLEAFLANPPARAEWVDEQIIEKSEMTAKTGRIQARLAYYWRSHMISSGQGGEVYTETACRTVGRVRCPDVAYLTPELVQQFGDFKVLPQSFPLVAEVISPSDEAEEVFLKVREYLTSQGREIWLVFPESQWVMVATQDAQKLLGTEDIAISPLVLPGFQVGVGELIA